MSNYSQAIAKLTEQAGTDEMKCVLAEIMIDTMTEESADAIVRSEKSLSDVISKMRDEARKNAKGNAGSVSPRRALEIAAEVFGFASNGQVISVAQEAAAPSTAPKAVMVDLLDLL